MYTIYGTREKKKEEKVNQIYISLMKIINNQLRLLYLTEISITICRIYHSYSYL